MKLSELKTKVHPSGLGGTLASCSFPNGYGASIITGGMAYGSALAPYELAVLHDNKLCYDSGLTDDVLGHLTEDEVNQYLLKIEALPAK